MEDNKRVPILLTKLDRDAMQRDLDQCLEMATFWGAKAKHSEPGPRKDLLMGFHEYFFAHVRTLSDLIEKATERPK